MLCTLAALQTVKYVLRDISLAFSFIKIKVAKQLFLGVDIDFSNVGLL